MRAISTTATAVAVAAAADAADAAAAVLEEYTETLAAEVVVDMARLRSLARHGVPSAVRGQVWCYLLGANQADRCAFVLPIDLMRALFLDLLWWFSAAYYTALNSLQCIHRSATFRRTRDFSYLGLFLSCRMLDELDLPF